MDKSAAVEKSQLGCLIKKQYWDDQIHVIADAYHSSAFIPIEIDDRDQCQDKESASPT